MDTDCHFTAQCRHRQGTLSGCHRVCVCAMDLHCLPPTHPARRPRTPKCQPPQSFLGEALRPQSLQTARPSPPTALHTAAHRHLPTQPSTPSGRSVSPKRNEIHMPQCGISVQLQACSPAAPHAGAEQGGEGPTAQGQGACTQWEKGWELATATGTCRACPACRSANAGQWEPIQPVPQQRGHRPAEVTPDSVWGLPR